MKLKVSQVINAIKPLTKINAPDLPIAVSMRLIDIMDKLGPVLEAFEARRKPLFDSYAVLSDPKNKRSKKEVPPKQRAKFNAEIQKIIDEEIEVPIAPLSLDDLEGVKISSSELRLIKWLIVVDPPEAE